MVTKDGLMRIFWPTDIASITKSGVLVGWRNSDLDIVVIGTLLEVEVSCPFTPAHAFMSFGAIPRKPLTQRRRAMLTMPSGWALCIAAVRTWLMSCSTDVGAARCKYWAI